MVYSLRIFQGSQDSTLRHSTLLVLRQLFCFSETAFLAAASLLCHESFAPRRELYRGACSCLMLSLLHRSNMNLLPLSGTVACRCLNSRSYRWWPCRLPVPAASGQRSHSGAWSCHRRVHSTRAAGGAGSLPASRWLRRTRFSRASRRGPSLHSGRNGSRGADGRHRQPCQPRDPTIQCSVRSRSNAGVPRYHWIPH